MFVDRAPPQMPDQHLYDALAPYGRVISVKHLTIKGFPLVKSGTRMVQIVISKAIPAEIRVVGFQLSFRYRGQPPTSFACQEVGHTAKDCPKSSKQHSQGSHTKNTKNNTGKSKPTGAEDSNNSPASSGLSKSSSASCTGDLCEKLRLVSRQCPNLPVHLSRQKVCSRIIHPLLLLARVTFGRS